MSWETVRVQGIAEVFDGPHATPPKSDDGPIYPDIPRILPDGGIDYENSKRISCADFPKWTKRITPRKDDVVFSYEANLESYPIIMLLKDKSSCPICGASSISRSCDNRWNNRSMDGGSTWRN